MNAAAEKLQQIHRPIGNLFPAMKDRKSHDFSQAWVSFFRENGFVKGGRVLNTRQIEALREALERIRTGENPRRGELYEIDEDYRREPDQNVLHFLGAWLIEEAFHDLLWHPAITVKASQLLESRSVRLWHDQVFYKPARHPGVVTWHQDYSYWTRAVPARHITCWIGLDDSDLDNGCLHFVPGSHRWDLLPKVSLTKDMNAIKGVMTPEQLSAFDPVPMILRAGECTFHHSHLLHGSWGNRSDRPRRAIVLNFMHPETRSNDGMNPLLSGVPIVPAGAIIDGDYFPIVLD